MHLILLVMTQVLYVVYLIVVLSSGVPAVAPVFLGLVRGRVQWFVIVEGFLVRGGVFFLSVVVLALILVDLVVLMLPLSLALTHMVLEMLEVLKYS